MNTRFPARQPSPTRAATLSQLSKPSAPLRAVSRVYPAAATLKRPPLGPLHRLRSTDGGRPQPRRTFTWRAERGCRAGGAATGRDEANDGRTLISGAEDAQWHLIVAIYALAKLGNRAEQYRSAARHAGISILLMRSAARMIVLMCSLACLMLRE